jgi:ribosome maturation protein Sdo1
MAEGLKVKYMYRPDASSANEEYWIVANPGMPEKWKQDPSTPLTDVVQSFDIFKGHGKSGQAPQADLLYALSSRLVSVCEL